MIYSKEIAPMCLYCEHSTPGPVGDQLLCPIKGVVDYDYACKKYVYDPLKREPAPKPRLKESPSPERFKID